MVEGDGDRLTQEYFRLIEEILKSRGQSARNLSRRIGKSHPYFSRLKNRKQLGRSWEIVEKGLGLSPKTLLSVLTTDVEYDQVLEAFGPQEEPENPDLLAEFGTLLSIVETLPSIDRAAVSAETWRSLEDLEWRRFKDRPAVEAECQRIVLGSGEQKPFQREDAVLAVGALGIWCTTRRHAEAMGDATAALLLAIRAASRLGIKELLARQLQRASYLLGDVGQFLLAESMAEAAVGLCADRADVEGMGKALIDTGMAAYGGRELCKAEARLLLGAGLLGGSPMNHINKASAYHLAAKCCSMRGEMVSAIAHLEEAAKYAGSYRKEWAAIRWCAGNIQFQLGNYAQAESALREALQIYLAANRVPDTVMLLLDLAMILVAQNRLDQVSELARTIKPLLDHSVERQQIRSYIEEAHACLLRAKHRQALKRFRDTYEQAWRNKFATP